VLAGSLHPGPTATRQPESDVVTHEGHVFPAMTSSIAKTTSLHDTSCSMSNVSTELVVGGDTNETSASIGGESLCSETSPDSNNASMTSVVQSQTRRDAKDHNDVDSTSGRRLQTAATATTADSKLTSCELQRLRVSRLKAECRARCLPVSGTKSQLVSRLQQLFTSHTVTEPRSTGHMTTGSSSAQVRTEQNYHQLEGIHRVRTHAVLLYYNPNPNM